MKRFFLTAVVLMAASLCLNAQVLWKISGKGLEEPSYIFGTHHMAPVSVLEQIDGFESAYGAVDKVCGELVMSKMQGPEAMGIMQSLMAMPEGQTLKSLYSEEEYARIADLFKKLSGMDLALMNGVKPSAVMQQIVLLMNMKHFPDFNMNEQLDGFMQNRAIADKKEVAGLETIEQQLDLLFGTPVEEQAESLLYIVDNEDKTLESTEELSELYMDQDIKGLLKFMEKESRSGDGSDLDGLLYSRNAAWAEVMPGMMKEGPVMFVVGAGHLPGKKGVLKLLKKQGFKVAPVR